MPGHLSWTPEALDNIASFDLVVEEVMQVLRSPNRLTRHLGDDAACVYGTTGTGRYVVVLLGESDNVDDDWDILAARDMTETEIKHFEARRHP